MAHDTKSIHVTGLIKGLSMSHPHTLLQGGAPQAVAQPLSSPPSSLPRLSQLPLLLLPSPLIGLPLTCQRLRELELALARARDVKERMRAAGDVFDEEDLGAADASIATAQSALDAHARTFNITSALAIAAGFAERVHERGAMLESLSAAGASPDLTTYLQAKQVRLAFQASEMLRLAMQAE